MSQAPALGRRGAPAAKAAATAAVAVAVAQRLSEADEADIERELRALLMAEQEAPATKAPPKAGYAAYPAARGRGGKGLGSGLGVEVAGAKRVLSPLRDAPAAGSVPMVPAGLVGQVGQVGLSPPLTVSRAPRRGVPLVKAQAQARKLPAMSASLGSLHVQAAAKKGSARASAEGLELMRGSAFDDAPFFVPQFHDSRPSSGSRGSAAGIGGVGGGGGGGARARVLPRTPFDDEN